MKNNWKKVKLEDIAYIKMGQSPKSKYYNQKGEGLPFFQGRTEFGYIHPQVKKWCTKELRKAKTNDILMTVRAPVGDLNISKLECIIGRGLCAIRSKEKVNNFLFYLLKANKDYISSKGSGAVYNSINKSQIHSLKFYLPNRRNQKKIGSILSAYDKLIENNKKRIKILEEMAQTIYKEWFVNFKFPGHENVKMIDSELGKIPEGWEVKKLAEIVSSQYGYTESAREEKVGPKFLRGKDINKESYINWESVPYCPIENGIYEKFKLHEGDILVIRMADPGKVGIVEKNIKAVFASYLIRFKITSNIITPYYLFYFMLSDRYQKWATGASTGTTRKSASARVLKNIEIIIPSKELNLNFDNIVIKIRKEINILLDKNSLLKRQRDILLPKLISGEIDVSDLDIN